MNTEWTEETVHPYIFKEVEVSDDGHGWHKYKLNGFYIGALSPFDTCDGSYKYMRPIKAKKKIIKPWTQETCPWPLSIRFNGADRLSLYKDSEGITLGGCGFLSYEALTREYQTNGEPCGIVEEVDE